jgi:hypothetical protein
MKKTEMLCSDNAVTVDALLLNWNESIDRSNLAVLADI